MDLNATLGDATRCLLSVNAAVVGTRSGANEVGHFTDLTVRHRGMKFQLYGFENREYLEFSIHCRLSNLFYGRIPDEEVENEISESEREVSDEEQLRADALTQLAAKRVLDLDEEERESAFDSLRDYLSQRSTRAEYNSVILSDDDTLDGVTLKRRIYPSENTFDVADFGMAIDEFVSDYDRVDTVLRDFSVFDEDVDDGESTSVESADRSRTEEQKFPSIQ